VTTLRVRISDRMDEMLEEMCLVFGLTKTGLVRSLIREKYEETIGTKRKER